MRAFLPSPVLELAEQRGRHAPSRLNQPVTQDRKAPCLPPSLHSSSALSSALVRGDREQLSGTCQIWTSSAMQRWSSRLRADLLAQKYGPPDEGRDDTISAIARPTLMVMPATSTQPHTVGTGPPLLKASPKEPVIPVRMLMMLQQAAHVSRPQLPKPGRSGYCPGQPVAQAPAA